MKTFCGRENIKTLSGPPMSGICEEVFDIYYVTEELPVFTGRNKHNNNKKNNSEVIFIAVTAFYK